MAVSYCFLSTYPPTRCGLASFTAALLKALTPARSPDRAGVVRVIETTTLNTRTEVVEHLRAGATDAPDVAAAALNRHDIAIVQHEYGIFGGSDGDEVLAVLDRVRVPVIVVLHTVLATPTPHQRSVLNQVAAAADAVVAMTEAARDRLIAGYGVDIAKVSVIPHGAATRPLPHNVCRDHRPTVLTWGLLGPGKGIEWGLFGLRELRLMHPRPRYVVAGQTHPRVRHHQGEAYRIGLGTRTRALGLTDSVRFQPAYLDESELSRLISRADVVLLPYDSREQVTSGVLVEAIAAHKPVVATAFPHAVEMLSNGAGLLVPHRDGPAIGAALRRVLTDAHLADRMSAEAARIAPGLRWPSVAARYRSLANDVLATRSAARR